MRSTIRPLSRLSRLGFVSIDWIDDITDFSFYTLREMSEAGLMPFEHYDEEDAAEWGYDSVEDISIQSSMHFSVP